MKISNHAKLRMAERNISDAQIIDTVKNGKSRPHRDHPNRVLFNTKNFWVVIDTKAQVLVTVFYN